MPIYTNFERERALKNSFLAFFKNPLRRAKFGQITVFICETSEKQFGRPRKMSTIFSFFSATAPPQEILRSAPGYHVCILNKKKTKTNNLMGVFNEIPMYGFSMYVIIAVRNYFEDNKIKLSRIMS